MRSILIVVISLLLGTSTSFSQSNEPPVLRLGTASPTGSYFQVGSQIKQLAEQNITQLSIDVLNTGGSVDNLIRLKNGELDLAIVQNDIAYLAENGETETIESMQTFINGYDSLAAIMTFYPEPIFVLTSRTGYTRPNQLRGLTISIGNRGSGTAVNAVTILEELGILDEVTIAYGDKGDVGALLESDSVQAVFMNSFPANIEEALDSGFLKILSLPRTTLESLGEKFDYFSPHKTELHGAQINTLAVKSMLVARMSLSEEIVYRLTEELDREWEYFSSFFPGHLPEYERANLVKNKALKRFHPGSERYFLDSRLLRESAPRFIIWMFSSVIGFFILLGLVNLVLFAFNKKGLQYLTTKLTNRSRFLKTLKKTNVTVIKYKYILLAILIVGCYPIILIFLEYFEMQWTRVNGLTNLFQTQSFFDNLLWLFVFAGSGYEGGIFPKSPVGQFIASLVPVIGASGLAAFIGIFATDKIKKQLLNQKGMSSSHKTDHIIICGWNQNVPDLVNFLVHENTVHDRPVVILADLEKPIALHEYDIDTDRVEYIKGTATNRADLKRANLSKAATAIIVADESVPDPDAFNVVKTLTIEQYCRELEKGDLRNGRENIYTIAEINKDEYREVANFAEVDQIISFKDIQPKILAQAALHPGVNEFLNEILTFNDRNDIYQIEVEENSQLKDKPFDTVLGLLRKKHILLLSVCYEGKDERGRPEQKVETNPLDEEEFTIKVGHTLIVLAKDENVIEKAEQDFSGSPDNHTSVLDQMLSVMLKAWLNVWVVLKYFTQVVVGWILLPFRTISSITLALFKKNESIDNESDKPDIDLNQKFESTAYRTPEGQTRIIICGWNREVPKLARHLIHKNNIDKRHVDILAPINRPEELLELELSKEFGKEFRDRVSFIQGSTTNIEDLKRANFKEAGIAIIVSDDYSESQTPQTPTSIKIETGDNRSVSEIESIGLSHDLDEYIPDPDTSNILKILAVEKYCKLLENEGDRVEENNIYTIAEINKREFDEVARFADVDEIISFREIRSKILAQSSLHPGVYAFLNEILTLDDKNDIYHVPIHEETQFFNEDNIKTDLIGKNFDFALKELRKLQNRILLLSIRTGNTSRSPRASHSSQTSKFTQTRVELLAKYGFDTSHLIPPRTDDEISSALRSQHQIITNPLNDEESRYQIQAGDSLIVLAKDEAAIDAAFKQPWDAIPSDADRKKMVSDSQILDYGKKTTKRTVTTNEPD